MTNWRQILGKIALTAFGLLLAWALMEAAVRTYAVLAVKERTLEYDPVLGWKLRPRARRYFRDEAEPYLIQTNSRGLRDREHTYEKPANTFRIVVLGDSFVFGSGGVPAESRFTDLLEKRDPHLEVINLGVPGYSTDQEYLILKTEGLLYHPDLVVMCMFVNDFRESFLLFNPSIGRPKGYFSSEGRRLIYHPPAVSKLYEWADRGYVLAAAERVWLNLTHRRPARVSMQLPVAGAEKTFRTLLEATDDLCRANGAEFALVYLPFKGQVDAAFFRQAMEELHQARGVPTMDLTNYIREMNAQKPAYFNHDIHFNSYGNQLVAERLYDFLIQDTALKRSVAMTAAGDSTK